MALIKNNYSFNVIDTVNIDNYNNVVIIDSNHNFFTPYLTSLQINITDYIDDKTYKGPKGEMHIFNIKGIRFILVVPDGKNNLTGIIGYKLSDTEFRENQRTLVLIHDIPIELASYHINDLLQGLYRFDELKTVESINITIDFHLPKLPKEAIQQIIDESKIIYDIRDLVNKPVNILNSTTYHEHIISKIATNKNIKMTVLNKAELTANRMNLVLAVNKGSVEEPKMIILDYNPDGAINRDKPIFLVGKGVMFDTGGINHKFGKIVDMKSDMVGSAVVYGVLKNLALHKCNKRVVGILLVVQNDSGSDAVHPGDVVKSHSGKTVEITDTDAEGRLILADGISYSGTFCKQNNCSPSLIIDIGSLTGQMCQIFDNYATGFMTNDTTNNIKTLLEEIACSENDYVWQLPLWSRFIKKNKSSVADYQNYSYNSADSIMCGSFLYNFLPNPQIPWLHLDIAGTSYTEEVSLSRYEGATGNMLRTLSRFLMKIDVGSLSKLSLYKM